MDYNTNNDPKHIWIATYGTTGKIYGYSIEDNQNAINVTPVRILLNGNFAKKLSGSLISKLIAIKSPPFLSPPRRLRFGDIL